MLFFQNAKPGGSASRNRKSRYCWRTKASVSSSAFSAGAGESSIVTVALAGEVKTAPAPVGLDKFTLKVSGPSAKESWVIGIVNVFCVCVAANLKVPNVKPKSQRAAARPLFSVLQTIDAPVSSVV